MNIHDQGMANTLALLDRLKSETPDLWDQAQVVGRWVWLEFTVPPLPQIRTKLKKLGFHWNGPRKCWQHPCGLHRDRSPSDPRLKYPPVPATVLQMNEAMGQIGVISAKEYKVISLRECPLPEHMQVCENAQQMADYWRLHIASNPYFKEEQADCMERCPS